MPDDFILRALLAGGGVAIVGGVLGCFVVWRRMAYFSDSLAHSGLLGAALGGLYGINLNLTVLAVGAVFAVLLVLLRQQKRLATDTLLGILSHTALAAGICAISLLPPQTIDLHSFLFGDILTVHPDELYWLFIGGVLALLLLVGNWTNLVLAVAHEDIAQAEGINTARAHLVLVFLMTLAVALSIRIVGVLLITSLLIIPAAAARQITRSPEAMAVVAALIGVGAVVGGIGVSVWLDTPSGASIVLVAALFFASLATATALRRR